MGLAFLTLPGERETGLKELRDFTSEAKSLIIVDRYIFSGKKENAEQIAKEFSRSARLAGKWLKQIHFVHDPSQTTQEIEKHVTQRLNDEDVRMTSAHVTEIHDRIWIADRKRAIVVGTSLNGIGKRSLAMKR